MLAVLVLRETVAVTEDGHVMDLSLETDGICCTGEGEPLWGV